MKLVLISSNFPPVFDGVGDYTLQLTSEFARNGHQVFVITSKFTENGLINKTVNVFPIIKRWNIVGFYKCWKKVEEIGPDWTFLQYVPYSFHKIGMPFPVLLFSILMGKKLSIMFHEFATDIGFRKFKYLPVSLSQFFIGRQLALRARLSIVSVGVLYADLKKRQIHVAHIPVGSNIHQETMTCQSGKGDNIIVSFGNRDHSLLIRAMHQLKSVYPELRLVLLGKINEANTIRIRNLVDQCQLQEVVQLTGPLSNEELQAYLYKARIFVLLEKVNAYGQGGASTKSGALAAAFASGLPIISTKGHLTDDCFKDRENILFCQEIADDVQEKISLILNDEALENKLRKNANDFHRKYLSWAAIYQAYMQAMK